MQTAKRCGKKDSRHHAVLVRGGSLMLVFVAGWLVMLLAMMLPASLPLVLMWC